MRHGEQMEVGQLSGVVVTWRMFAPGGAGSAGFAITLTEGRELARFTGQGAKRRALGYLASHHVTRDLADVR